MSESKDRITEVVKRGLGPALKVAGYRKKGFHFRQEISPIVTRLVTVSCSPWNSAAAGQFTLDLGVYHRDIAALHDAMPVVNSPTAIDCVIRQRIGFVMPVGRDYWWQVSDKTDFSTLGTKVASAWINYGNPWLESHSSLREGRRFLAAQNHFFLAAMASVALGEPAEAHRWLDRAVRDWPGGADRIETWRRTHLGDSKRDR
jgi:hypothetical protein